MTTLLLVLSGPMQSWGSSSRFSTRSTDTAPTKSGVIGLIAAALGLPRTASLEEFSPLDFGIRIDQPGSIERDYQTAMDLDGKSAARLSTRYYLADAVFLAALSHPDEQQLDRYSDALRSPVFAPYLGRRAFPPSGPILSRTVTAGITEALRQEPWHASARVQASVKSATTWLETRVDIEPGNPAAELTRDVPRSFDPRSRKYAVRTFLRSEVEVPNPAFKPENADTELPAEHDSHDAMGTLEGLE